MLGPVTIRLADDPPASSRVTQPRHLALLAYLALARPRGLHPRDVLMALLWPERDEASARHALRNALHGIRRRLGGDVIVTAGEQLIALDTARIHCDAIELERGVRTAPDGITPFEGLHVRGAPDFDRWMSREADRLRALLERQPTRGGLDAPESPARSRVPGVHAPGAYGEYVRGHYLFLRSAHGGFPDELARCRWHFERALALDPQFAPALAGLANYYAVAARRGVLAPFESVFDTVVALSERALAIDPSLAIPYVHFGVRALYLSNDWDGAGAAFAHAVANEPDYAEGRRFYGVWLGLVNRPVEALPEMEAAARLEPDIPHILSSLGAARLAVGDVSGAESALRRTLELDPRHGPARERLVRLLEDEGRYADAVVERSHGGDAARAAAFSAAWKADGESGYRRTLEDMLRGEVRALETRLRESAPRTVADRFAPPVVRLVTLLQRLGHAKRALAWRLEATSAQPTLARWFASVRESK